MMSEFIIGSTRIPMDIQENDRLKRSRLSVDKNGILVEIPKNVKREDVLDFIEGKKEWIFNRWEDAKGRNIQNVWPERFVSGAKVMFLGRMELLEIIRGTESSVRFTTRGFQITTPTPIDSSMAKSLLVQHFQTFLLEIVNKLVAIHAEGKIQTVRFTQRKDRWAYCDEDGVIHIGWDLAFLPKKLIEYVLKHELCHLKHMNHSPLFWSELKLIEPDYTDHQKMLSDWEHMYEI